MKKYICLWLIVSSFYATAQVEFGRIRQSDFELKPTRKIPQPMPLFFLKKETTILM
ncbi:hypothetical protein [Flagellimonas sp.]|uniref:hypothetical protein n=1 Tax=Flagellimonas sp. TaxID=2058762 RepID=UPI003B597677